jgi:hypothetical protein
MISPVMIPVFTRDAPDTDLAGYPVRPDTGYPAEYSAQHKD